MAKNKASASERPSIYNADGEVHGQLELKCADTFAAAVAQCNKNHGRGGLVAYTAATDLLRGFSHLTETHKMPVLTAYKHAAAQVKDRRNLTSPAFKAAVDIAAAHGTQGQMLQDASIGRSPE